MITIGVLMSNAYADYSSHIIRGLCRRAKEQENVNLIFFPGMLDSDLEQENENRQADGCADQEIGNRQADGCADQEIGNRQAGGYADAVDLVDVLIISDQNMLQMLLERPEGSQFANVLERIPYMLLKDDTGQVFEQACLLAEGRTAEPPEPEEVPDEDLFARPRLNKAQRRNRFERALEFAMKAHKGQVRKGSSVPYIMHPIETALIAMTLTRDQDIILAALFHDIIEDTSYSAKDIEDAFGSRVAHLVQMESENKRKGQDASETWKIRKQEFIDGLDHKSRDEKIIALADKLSNMRATRQGYLKNNEKFWERFHQKDKKMHGWYYRTVAEKLREYENTEAWKELDRLIWEVFEM